MEQNIDTVGLKLRVGETLQLQFAGEDNKGRYYARVIGYLPGQSLLITVPRVNERVLLVREGQIFVVRMLMGSTVYGFNASVLRVAARPYPYLHLSYPRDMESSVVRKAQRVPVRIIAAVRNEEAEGGREQPVPVVIQDLSTAGALVACGQRLGALGDTLSLKFKLTVAGVDRYITAPALLRRMEELEEGEASGLYVRHGVEFQLLADDDSLALHGYVYERLSQHLAV